MMKTSEVLLEAKQHVARGWIRHVMVSPEGYCMLGAVDEVLKQRHLPTGDHIEAWTSVKEILRQKILELFPDEDRYGDSFSMIAEFNDARGRTQGQVLEVLDKAIAGCAERGE